MTTLYITEMHRWGDPESHHYVVGVYSTLTCATYAGEVEKSWRGGKYEPVIIELSLNGRVDPEKSAYHESCVNDPIPSTFSRPKPTE